MFFVNPGSTYSRPPDRHFPGVRRTLRHGQVVTTAHNISAEADIPVALAAAGSGATLQDDLGTASSTPSSNQAFTSRFDKGKGREIIVPELEDEDEEDVEEITRGPVQAWAKDNQLMLTYFVAGGMAGAASRTVVSPLERLKIILQVQPQQTKGASKQPGSKAYGGIWSSLVRMWKEEGWRGMMKGNGINCARIIPYSAVQFASYEAFKTSMKKWSGEDVLSTPLRLSSGALAGICSVVSTYPLDLVRSRLSIATASINYKSPPTTRIRMRDGTWKEVLDKDLGIMGMTKKVYRTEGGIKGLYRGIVATAAGVAPYVSLNFFFYESMKGFFIPEGTVDTGGIRTLLCGAVSGTVSQTLTYPFDVLRRKMQVAGMDGLGPKYSGALDAMIKISKAEGFFKGMYRGIWPNLLKVAPSIATSFFVYETVKESISYHAAAL